MDDQTKKWLSAPINPKIQSNIVRYQIAVKIFFWRSSIEFWDKTPSNFGDDFFFWWAM